VVFHHQKLSLARVAVLVVLLMFDKIFLATVAMVAVLLMFDERISLATVVVLLLMFERISWATVTQHEIDDFVSYSLEKLVYSAGLSRELSRWMMMISASIAPVSLWEEDSREEEEVVLAVLASALVLI